MSDLPRDDIITAHSFPVEEAEDIYAELGGLTLELDADPILYGPKRLNNKIAEGRRMLGICEQQFMSVSKRLHGAKSALRMAEAALQLATMDKLANDPETRAGRNVAQQEAIAFGKLPEQVRTKNGLDLSVQDLQAVLLVIKAKRADLKDTMGRLRDQIRLVHEERGLGADWQSQSPNVPSNILDKGTSADIDAVQLGSAAKGEVDLPSDSRLRRGIVDLLDDDSLLLDDPPLDPPEEEPDLDPLVPPTEPEKVIPPDAPQTAEEEAGFPNPHCEECGKPQKLAVGSGLYCENGHGGCGSVTLEEWEASQKEKAAPEPTPEPTPEPGPKDSLVDALPEDLLGDLSGPEDTNEEILEGTVTEDVVDDFLQDPQAIEGAAVIEDKKNPVSTVDLDDGVLEDLLAGFEAEDVETDD